ncbi:hypothetical protein JTE90_029047 [Oedothorax gibbosus]|uniref:Uncharacterized protein n=1 Tax=Oedothorax gibbosus TaxID=931172 RepID=A0AAV6UVG9_9ARAC|nr:hypothetical protein JTE90_029047 [Oedothorax gibbosus]
MQKFISDVLHPYSHSGPTVFYLVASKFLNSLLSFITMTVSASSVAEASKEVAATAAKKALDYPKTSSIEFQKFLLCTQGEINLTVWKIASIRRNFIVGCMGALFTYAMLVESFWK